MGESSGLAVRKLRAGGEGLSFSATPFERPSLVESPSWESKGRTKGRRPQNRANKRKGTDPKNRQNEIEN